MSQAASILDEEMARGVLAARALGCARLRTDDSDASNPVLRQMHDLVDNVARFWPSLQGPPAQRLVASQPAASDADALAEVRPRATVKPGQRATISMTLRNSESRACAPGSRGDGFARQPRRPDCVLASRVHAFGDRRWNRRNRGTWR